MATQTIITYLCDQCGREGSDDRPVRTHSLTIDKRSGSMDACDTCWERATGKALQLMAAAKRGGNRKTLASARR